MSSSSYESIFVRKSLLENLRLDGRGKLDGREVEIAISRTLAKSMAEICFGSTKVVCLVSGEIVSPFQDRPTEGLIEFSVSLVNNSSLKKNISVDEAELSRLLERSIRDSDAIDTESLCIIGGEKVWCIRCDLRVLDDGGNLADACSIATMAALRSFRKPEVSLSQVEMDCSRGSGRIKERPASSSDENIAISPAMYTAINIFEEYEREPTPLALHHTPLCVTLGIFKEPKADALLIVDPSSLEEAVMDGYISFAINAHREICAISKPGQQAVPVSLILQGTQIALARAEVLHVQLNDTLVSLEGKIAEEKSARLEQLRKSAAIDRKAAGLEAPKGGGAEAIDRNDPILQWGLLHRPALVRENTVEKGMKH